MKRREEGGGRLIFFLVWFGLVWRNDSWKMELDGWIDILYCTILYCTVCMDIALLNQSDSRHYTFFPTIREAGVVQ